MTNTNNKKAKRSPMELFDIYCKLDTKKANEWLLKAGNAERGNRNWIIQGIAYKEWHRRQ